jgi:hypothetical protein
MGSDRIVCLQNLEETELRISRSDISLLVTGSLIRERPVPTTFTFLLVVSQASKPVK